MPTNPEDHAIQVAQTIKDRITTAGAWFSVGELAALLRSKYPGQDELKHQLEQARKLRERWLQLMRDKIADYGGCPWCGAEGYGKPEVKHEVGCVLAELMEGE